MQNEGHSIAGGFGEALSSALDVMAFNHDLDMAGANGLNLQSNAIKVPPATIPNNIQGKTTQTVTTTSTTITKSNELIVPASGQNIFNQTKPTIDTGERENVLFIDEMSIINKYLIFKEAICWECLIG